MNLFDVVTAIMVWHAIDALREWWASRRWHHLPHIEPGPLPPHEPDTIELLAKEQLKLLRKMDKGDAPS